MPQFDVHKFERGLVIDCQSDLLSQIESRFVVPLVAQAKAPKTAARLNPIFLIAGTNYVMMTQTAAAVLRKDLGEVVASLVDHSFEITNAIDVLISGV